VERLRRVTDVQLVTPSELVVMATLRPALLIPSSAVTSLLVTLKVPADLLVSLVGFLTLKGQVGEFKLATEAAEVAIVGV